MTLLSRFGFQPQKRAWMLAPDATSTQNISIVIPVKNNQIGVTRFLAELLRTHPPTLYPGEVIIVDNQSTPPLVLPPARAPDALPVTLLHCLRPGPASARNVRIRHARTEWVLFADSDCLPTSTMLSGYLSAMNGAVGYAGAVQAWSQDHWSRYYDSQAILTPPPMEEAGILRPEHLITANALVWKPALEAVGRLDETIRIAAGEDIDLGFRLREIGVLSYAPAAVVFHDFTGGLGAFVRRFVRYGKGNKQVGRLHQLDLAPRVFRAKEPSLFNALLAKLQYLCLAWGYRTG